VDISEAELLERIAEGEGRSLEFKRGLPRDERLARTLCAFANTRGGLLLVGVEDDGRIVGAPRPRETASEIRRIARDFVEPPVRVEVRPVRCEEGVVVVARVNVSPERPHRLLRSDRDHEIVVRVGASNRVARGATLAALRAQRTASRPRNELERQILAWVRKRVRRSSHPGGDATPAGFGKAHNIGVQRARKAFVRLENDGLLVGHGRGSGRYYGLP
jgi:predicted HTH transcriptional regulator